MFNIQFLRPAAIFVITILAACNSVYTSKKKGYFRIDFPEHKYVQFTKEKAFPYTFEYILYMRMYCRTKYLF